MLTDASVDGSTLYYLGTSAEHGNQVLFVDRKTGAVTRTVTLDTPHQVRGIAVHPDGQSITAWVESNNNGLYLFEGFPTPTTGLERLFRKWTEPK